MNILILMFMMDSNSNSNSTPPLHQHYGALFNHQLDTSSCMIKKSKDEEDWCSLELPVIDLKGLKSSNAACEAAICRASSEWGFFQVVNHGISTELLGKMRREQRKLFETSFERKTTSGLLNNSYRWGTSTATSPQQFNWSEAFHIPLTKIHDQQPSTYGEFTSLREVMGEVAAAMSKLAMTLAVILTNNLGIEKQMLKNKCDESTCFLRLNHYPACPVAPETFGLVPHTDSDFLTILYQDQVGGLQLMKDSKWVPVKPNPDALIVNIGDLFQAWSNDVYRSVEHKVVANPKMERYSIAYFLCPSYDSVIGSCRQPSLYRNFTFREYREQVQADVKRTGQKVGLPRFQCQGTEVLTRRKEGGNCFSSCAA